MFKGKCKYWDSGWCYKEDSKYKSGCPGSDNCDYMKRPEETPFDRGHIALFIGFLAGTGALGDFRQKVDLSKYLLLTQPDKFVMDAFEWLIQPEGERYWVRVNRDWKRLLGQWRSDDDINLRQ